MAEYVIVPFFGTTRPAYDNVVQNGVPTRGGGHVGCYNRNGSQSPLFGFYLGGTYSTYMSLSPGYKFVYSSDSNGETAVSSPVSVSGMTIYVWNYSPPNQVQAVANVDTITLQRAYEIMVTSTPPEGSMNIKYAIKNGSVIGSTWTPPGGSVTAYITMNPGFSLKSQDISVTRNGNAIPFSYSNGVLTFTAPN